jgi:hypothetical protein
MCGQPAADASASPLLQELHDKLNAIEKRRENLEQKIVKTFGKPVRSV